MEVLVRVRGVHKTFARGGEKILDRIEAIEYRVWDKRPVVTKADVLRLFAGCLWRAARRGRPARVN